MIVEQWERLPQIKSSSSDQAMVVLFPSQHNFCKQVVFEMRICIFPTCPKKQMLHNFASNKYIEIVLYLFTEKNNIILILTN